MKALSIRISAGIISLGALLYFLACSPATKNDNSSQNQNVSSASGNNAPMDLSACTDFGSDPGGAHAKGIKKGIKDKMSASLKKLLKDADNPTGTFTIDVQKAENALYFVAYVRGRVSGDDNLKELSNILNDFQGKSECLRMVYLLPDQTTNITTGDPGFEWSSCEYPMVVCPNGECCHPTTANTNTSNVNTNSNGNSNANANANSNSNLRRGNP